MCFPSVNARQIQFCLTICCGVQLAAAQTSNCDDTPAGQLAVGTSCNPVTFNSTNNTDYWNDAWWYGNCNEDDYDDAWMWFDATSTSTTVSYTPSNGDAILTIFQGTCSTTSSANIACSDNIGTTAETVTFATIPGTRYHVRIQNYNSNANMNGTVCAYSAGGGTTTASDCSVATNICTNLSFQIDPNGYGSINEIPNSGTTSNPGTNPASSNSGCLLVGEYNSTWMVINISTSGSLEFVFGGLGAQAGYYDWIMYPYNGASTCSGVSANTVAPVRCNWNAVDYGGTGVSDVVPSGGNAGNFEPPLTVTAGQRYLICFSNYSNSVTTVPLQFLTDPGNAGVSCTPLGLTVEGLQAACFEDRREISWTAPVNNEIVRFSVEKSRDNLNWEPVGEVYNGELAADGRLHYVLNDVSNPNVLVYYRVFQHLSGGLSVPSGVISADCDEEQDLYLIYPNPGTDQLFMEYQSTVGSTLEFFDMYGNCILREKLERAVQPTTIRIDASDVPSGVYSYRLTMDSTVKTGSIIMH